jgi:hypothetical protein
MALVIVSHGLPAWFVMGTLFFALVGLTAASETARDTLRTPRVSRLLGGLLVALALSGVGHAVAWYAPCTPDLDWLTWIARGCYLVL